MHPTLAFLFRLAAFLTVAHLVDQGIAAGLDWARPDDYRVFVEAREAYDGERGYDVVVLGSSHAADAVIPSVIESSLGLSAFNFGIYHASPTEWFYLARDLLERGRPPNLVIIGTEPRMFMRPVEAGVYTADLIADPWIRMQLLATSFGTENVAVLFESGRKRDLLVAALKKLAGRPAPPPTRVIAGIDNGYLQNVRAMNSPAVDDDAEVARVETFAAGKNDVRQRQYLAAMIAALRAQRVEVVLVEPPLHPQRLEAIAELQPYHEFSSWLDAIANRYDIPIFRGYDGGYLARYADADFLNQEHVCFTGAWRFTRDVAAWLASLKPELVYTPVDPTPPLSCGHQSSALGDDLDVGIGDAAAG